MLAFLSRRPEVEEQTAEGSPCAAPYPEGRHQVPNSGSPGSPKCPALRAQPSPKPALGLATSQTLLKSSNYEAQPGPDAGVARCWGAEAGEGGSGPWEPHLTTLRF